MALGLFFGDDRVLISRSVVCGSLRRNVIVIVFDETVGRIWELAESGKVSASLGLSLSVSRRRS